jgi:hypothetical protein
MHHTKYAYQSETFLSYEFESEGPKGIVRKMVQYTKIEVENVYNLAFGDYDPLTKEIDDLSITNNGDSEKVLATVASTIYSFTEAYPQAWIVAKGSTPIRTRLYRMAISNNLDEICTDFVIFGYTSHGEWESFQLGIHYEAFLLGKKENDLSYENERIE